nr:NAD-dependent epimerase/dehydratase family protein [Hyperthermus butylicus]
MGERLLWRYMRDYGLKPVALRYFNVYGPRMRPGPYAGVVYKFITTLLWGGTPVIYGDGEQTRDFVYVGDVAEANLKALETRYTGPVNIGTGVETNINKLYWLICSLIGRCPEPRYELPRPGDVRQSKASIRLAWEKLGWKPATSLEEGLRRTIEYYRVAGTS